MRKFHILMLLGIIVVIIVSSTILFKQEYNHKTVLCIPVYGQSLALGEEAIRITDFDTLKIKYDGRIVTENLDYDFGYFDDEIFKQFIKKILHYNKRSYELSIYRMAEELTKRLGEDTIICIFPGGRGGNPLDSLDKGEEPYSKFIDEIRCAYNKAKDRGWDFYIPAICWMQGETDITEYTHTNYNYRTKLTGFYKDICEDIKSITHQWQDTYMIVYQPNALSNSERFDRNAFDCPETIVPQTYIDILKEESYYWASGPTYPYTCINELVHIDAIGQQHLGVLDAISIMGIIRGEEKKYGLIPLSTSIDRNDILIRFNVPHPPLVFDTLRVKYAENYGFCVINKNSKNIISDIKIEDTIIRIKCSEDPTNCKVRYAINGDYLKSGPTNGPRGNLRDSQGDSIKVCIANKEYPIYNWCYQFDLLCK